MDTIQESIGWIAATFNICFYLSPTLNFVKVLKGKVNFEESPGVYVTTCYVNSFIWFIYGDMIFSDQVKISNMISALINLIFMLIYLAFELRKYFIDAILNTLILITGSWAVYRALTIVIDDDRVVGDICIGTTFIIFLSPIQILYKVFKEKNYNIIPVFAAIIYLSGCLSWFIYAIFIKDFYLAFPHALGVILSGVEIAVYVNCKRRYPGIGENGASGTIDIVSGGNDDIKKEETPIKIDEGKPVEIVNKLDN